MGYQAELLQLITGHAVGMNKVADIDQVSFKQLIESLGRVSAELQGRDRPLLERGECVGNEALRSQLLIDLTERRLPFVEIDELQFRLDHYGIL